MNKEDVKKGLELQSKLIHEISEYDDFKDSFYHLNKRIHDLQELAKEIEKIAKNE